MNNRTLLLSGIAAVVFVLYLVEMGYRTLIEGPTQRYQGELHSIEQKLADANTSQITGRRLANRLEPLAQRALPYDPALARSSYQDWLLKLVEQHQMESAAVDADTPQPIEIRGTSSNRKSRRIGYRIGFNLRAKTTLANLTDFLHAFHASAQLHKIRGFSLSPLVNGNQLELTLAIETLSLEASDREGELSQVVRGGEAFPSRSSFDQFVNRNLFAKGFSKSLGQVRLNAVTQNRDGELEGWFSVGSPPKTQIVAQGGMLEIPLHMVKVIGFDEDRVELSVNDFVCWIALGQNLATVLGDSSSSTASKPSLPLDPSHSLE